MKFRATSIIHSQIDEKTSTREKLIVGGNCSVDVGAADNLTGTVVTGERRSEQWKIGAKIQYTEGISPGHHSVGYCAESSHGKKAFLKATDLRMAGVGSPDFLRKLKSKVDAHTFERSLLDHVQGRNMDKIVVVLDYGSLETNHDGALYSVLFLVFEFAEGGDLRKHVKIEESLDLIDIINVAHNIANAVAQLHNGKICHNDLKPGNCLVFDKVIQKLGDLGRATSEDIAAPHDGLFGAGDPQYAPPEQLYDANAASLGFDMLYARKLGDIYGFGSLLHYLLCARMITPEIMQRLDHLHRPHRYRGGWGGSYYDVLPFVRTAWVTLFEELRASNPEGPLNGITAELILIAEKASDPDPRQRGHFVNGKQTLSLQQFMSRFDLLRRRAAVLTRA